MYSPYTDVRVRCNGLDKQISVTSYSCFHSYNIGRRCNNTRSSWPRQISCWLSTLVNLPTLIIQSCFGHMHFHILHAFCDRSPLADSFLHPENKLLHADLVWTDAESDTSFFPFGPTYMPPTATKLSGTRYN